LKSDRYQDDRELRISLSAVGIGHFMLDDGRVLEFPPSLHISFDFKTAFTDGIITQLLFAQDCDKDFLRDELGKLRIVPVENGKSKNDQPIP
jgi:hypothetical protein